MRKVFCYIFWIVIVSSIIRKSKPLTKSNIKEIDFVNGLIKYNDYIDAREDIYLCIDISNVQGSKMFFTIYCQNISNIHAFYYQTSTNEIEDLDNYKKKKYPNRTNFPMEDEDTWNAIIDIYDVKIYPFLYIRICNYQAQV